MGPVAAFSGPFLLPCRWMLCAMSGPPHPCALSPVGLQWSTFFSWRLQTAPWFACHSFCGSYGDYPTLVLFWFQVCPSRSLTSSCGWHTAISNPTRRRGVEWRAKREVRGLGRKSSQEVTVLPSFKTAPATKLSSHTRSLRTWSSLDCTLLSFPCPPKHA